MRFRPLFQSAWRIVVCLALVGCQTATVTSPVTAKLGGDDDDQQLEFWHTLAEQPIACNDDAFHGLLLSLDGHDTAKDYAGRVATLKARKLLPADFDEPADLAVKRGTIAVALTQALNIKGGWAMRAFGPTPRYATRELQYLDLYPPSSPNQTFSGTEFLGIIGKFEDAQHADAPVIFATTQSVTADIADVQQPGDRQAKETK